MRIILLFITCLPLLSIAQDRLILTSLDTLNVKILKSSPSNIEFLYPGEESVNVMPKNRIFKIEYSSGRIEVVRSIEEQQGESFRPKSKTLPRFRWGLRGGINQPFISGLGVGSINKIGGMAGISTEVKFINTQHGILLDAYINQMYAKSPDGNDAIEVVYVSLPMVYNVSFNNWFSFLIGFEPSITAYADYYQSGAYYDASTLANDVVLGITAGARFMVHPRKIYVDVRGVGGITNMFSFADNSPSKVNLSVGYYIKY